MSKTKEEILFEEGNKALPDGIYPGMANDKIYNAMDAWAKERSIAFAEWCAAKGYARWIGMDGKWHWQDDVTITYTTDQLFNLFIQSI